MSATHNEGSSVFVDFVFTDENEQPVAPTLAYYRIDDGDDEEILDWTLISGTMAAEMSVTVPPTLNLVPNGPQGKRHITCRYFYGDPEITGTLQYFYLLNNLHGI